MTNGQGPNVERSGAVVAPWADVSLVSLVRGAVRGGLEQVTFPQLKL